MPWDLLIKETIFGWKRGYYRQTDSYRASEVPEPNEHLEFLVNCHGALVDVGLGQKPSEIVASGKKLRITKPLCQEIDI